MKVLELSDSRPSLCLEDVKHDVEEGEQLLAHGRVHGRDKDGKEPESNVNVVLDAVVAERLGLRDFVQHVLHEVANHAQSVLDHGLG